MFHPIPRHNPLDYGLCNQTVTVYHWDGGTTYTRTVHKNAFLDFKRTKSVDKGGSGGESTFLLVIPGDTMLVAVGDKVMLGEGPEVTDRESWAALIPSKVPGLVVVRYVDPKYWCGSVVHTEAGG